MVVYRLTRFNHFLILSHPYTTQKVAKLYMELIYRLHGFPESIVSNRDKVFTSHFWQELFRASGVKLETSTAYHPQIDRLT